MSCGPCRKKAVLSEASCTCLIKEQSKFVSAVDFDDVPSFQLQRLTSSAVFVIILAEHSPSFIITPVKASFERILHKNRLYSKEYKTDFKPL